MSADPRSVADAFYGAFARREGAAMAALYSDHATFSDPVFPGLRGGSLPRRSPDAASEHLYKCTDERQSSSSPFCSRADDAAVRNLGPRGRWKTDDAERGMLAEVPSTCVMYIR